jgi:parallel beta-helix repeat protein
MLLPLGLNFLQNSVFRDVAAVGDSSSLSTVSFPLRARDFVLQDQSNPILGIVSTGQSVAISMTIQNIARIQISGQTYYITEVLNKNGSPESIQIQEVSLAGPALMEMHNYWIPQEPGEYKVFGFLWTTESGAEQVFTPLTNKTSLSMNVKSAPTDNAEKTYTMCKDGCDYTWLQTAIDRSSKPGEKILVKDGSYNLDEPINLQSNTKLEFSKHAIINFLGNSGSAVFQGKNVQNIEIINPHISVKKEKGVNAFSFNSSKIINITGGEIRLVQGEDSAGFYCRDCTNVLISDVLIKKASRFVDIGTNAQINNGRSSNIWILNGKFDSSSNEAVKVDYSNNVYIIGNDISNTNDNAIDISYNYHTLVKDNKIKNGGIPFGSSIHIDSAADADISENFINGTMDDGIRVYGASNINIFNNTIVNSEEGVAILTGDEPSSDIRIDSNHIINILNYGIFVSANQHNVEIFGNRLEKIGQDKAIHVDLSNISTTVSGNIFLQ